jgi:hypothetical protein
MTLYKKAQLPKRQVASCLLGKSLIYRIDKYRIDKVFFTNVKNTCKGSSYFSSTLTKNKICSSSEKLEMRSG